MNDVQSRIQRFLAENSNVSPEEFNTRLWEVTLVKSRIVSDATGGLVSGLKATDALQEAAELVMVYYENRAIVS